MLPESFPVELVTWDLAYRLARTLSDKIKRSGFRPGLVVAIGRGGYVPARVVCDFLLLEQLTSIKIEHWGIAAQIKERAVVRFPLAVDIRGQRVLVVDDVTDTGDTLTVAAGYLREFGPAEIRTAVLQHKETSSFRPDYYADYILEWKWIVYPWAVHEDLVGFTERVLGTRPLSLQEISARLQGRFRMEVDEGQLRRIIDELQDLGRIRETGDGYVRAA